MILLDRAWLPISSPEECAGAATPNSRQRSCPVRCRCSFRYCQSQSWVVSSGHQSLMHPRKTQYCRVLPPKHSAPNNKAILCVRLGLNFASDWRCCKNLCSAGCLQKRKKHVLPGTIDTVVDALASSMYHLCIYAKWYRTSDTYLANNSDFFLSTKKGR